MQFKKVGNRIQCYAAWYDKDKKRGRQRLVYTLSAHIGPDTLPEAKDLAPDDFGTPEQRKAWAADIGAYIIARNEEHRQKRTENIPFMLKASLSHIRQEHSAGNLKETQIAEIKDALKHAAMHFGLMVYDRADVKTAEPARRRRKTETPTTGEDPRAFGGELVDVAKKLRAEGLSIAATAERMTADGHKVSASWVQKWTAAAATSEAEQATPTSSPTSA